MKYKITKIDKKVFPTGKERADVTLQDVNGVIVEMVSIWKNSTDFDAFAVGTELTGSITEKQNGSYLNKTFYPVRANESFKAKPSGMVTAVKEKAASIGKAMDRKEDSIKLAGTARDATILTQSYVNARLQNNEEITIEGMKNIWKEWRKFLIDNFGDEIPFI